LANVLLLALLVFLMSLALLLLLALLLCWDFCCNLGFLPVLSSLFVADIPAIY
jgi:hypothetical protein